MIENALAPAVEALFVLLDVPGVTNLATGGVVLQGDEAAAPCVILINQDGTSNPAANVQGEELISTVNFSVLAMVKAGSLAEAALIDNEVRKRLLSASFVKELSVPSGTVYSITMSGARMYNAPGKGGVGQYLYYGATYRIRAQGNEL